MEKNRPKQWEELEIMIMHKKGDEKNLDNYRPLSLTSDLKNVY